MFRRPPPEEPRPGVAELQKALWYAERGHIQRARIAAKEALLKLKEAEMPGVTNK